jgi:GAF domain-containing protein
MTDPTPTGGRRTPGFRTNSAQEELLPLLTEYLDDVSRSTAAELGEVAGVAVTISVDGSPFTVGANNDLARDVDLIQYRIGRGPCLHALHYGEGLYVPDLATDERWGEYGPQAAARGAASCVSVPVVVDGYPAAVFKVYSGEVDGLSQDQRRLAQDAARDIVGGVMLAMMTLTQVAQSCSANFPTWWRCQL